MENLGWDQVWFSERNTAAGTPFSFEQSPQSLWLLFLSFRPQPRVWSPLHFQSFLFLGFHFLECFSILDWFFTSGTKRHIFNTAGCVQLYWGVSKGATWDWSWICVTAAFFSQNIWVSLVFNLMGMTLRNFYFNSNCCVNSIYTIYSFWFRCVFAFLAVFSKVSFKYTNLQQLVLDTYTYEN